MRVFTFFVLSMPLFQTNFLYSWIVLTSIAADMKFPSAAEYALFYYWRGLGFGFVFFKKWWGWCLQFYQIREANSVQLCI